MIYLIIKVKDRSITNYDYIYSIKNLTNTFNDKVFHQANRHYIRYTQEVDPMCRHHITDKLMHVYSMKNYTEYTVIAIRLEGRLLDEYNIHIDYDFEFNTYRTKIFELLKLVGCYSVIANIIIDFLCYDLEYSIYDNNSTIEYKPIFMKDNDIHFRTVNINDKNEVNDIKSLIWHF